MRTSACAPNQTTAPPRKPSNTAPLPPDRLTSFRQRWVPCIEKELARCLPPERTSPVSLHKAMRYSLLGGGKRLRPLFALAAAEAAGADPSVALRVGAAVECLHTYSLIHDDLPCMDDDDLRRGQPTCHKVFGEAIAVLAGDALLTQAFLLLAEQPGNAHHKTADFVRVLAEAAGSRHLLGGQVADLEGEKRTVSLPELRFIHEGKTAALLSASIRLGAMAGGASPGVVETFGRFGHAVGLAFQVQDDILDMTQPSEVLGKSAGKDVASGKATYPGLLGLDGARRESARLTKKGVRFLESAELPAPTLQSLAQWLLQRNS
jgi:geranylgeranyl diphosphate synthase type II